MSCFYFCFFLLIFVFKVLGFLINNNQLQKTVLANQKEADYIIFRKEHSSNPQNKALNYIDYQ